MFVSVNMVFFCIFAKKLIYLNMKKILLCAVAMLGMMACGNSEKVYYAKDFGVVPNTGEDMTEEVAKALVAIKTECEGKPARLVFESGEYDFYPDSANKLDCYISNHDQVNPRLTAVVMSELKNVTLSGDTTGGGKADFMMNGRMMPLAMLDCENCALSGIAIDTRVPQIAQVEVLENDTINSVITYKIADYVNYKVVDGRLVVSDHNWELTPCVGIAFEGKTGRLIYRTSDINIGVNGIEEIAPRTIRAPWDDKRLVPGSVVAMRTYDRPTPGIFIARCKDTKIEDVTVHYAEGMALLAQNSENVTLDGFSVAPREGSGRYFTTQADASHFSGCKGMIDSRNGLYSGMMDDAINVHGTYLRIVERLDANTVVGRYMHPQAYGFYWGGEGDSVQFVRSSTMEVCEPNMVVSVAPYDKDVVDGAKDFKITLRDSVSADIASGDYGIENLEWTPEVIFKGNTIRNNRARGALFSTPKDVLVEDNFFDHTSGTAILLCGDCNGWFETGACRNVVIRNNRFVNALTNMFQFTDGIISIYPEIPNLDAQQKYFHGGPGMGVVIENNEFETFDSPIVYAKSLDGLVFRGNKIVQNNDYAPFHWNTHRFLFDRVVNATIENNEFSTGFDAAKDLMLRK